MNSLDFAKAIGFVNKIIDNVRCGICDKLEGTRVRYQCGHIACDDCVTYAQDCQACSPPSLRSAIQPKFDKQLTQTVKSAVGLLNACHKFFDSNAFQRKRLSEQLRIEKELFPNCIQAPAKYENKRKSTLTTNENNSSTFFPGEEVRLQVDMAHTTNYVQQWLKKNESNLARKPFSDLNVNTSWANKPISKNIKQNETIFLGAGRKRSHRKVTDKMCARKESINSVYNKFDSIPKRAKNKNVSYSKNINPNILRKCNNDESGIFMEDEPIVICDSQETAIDKDTNAWLSVLKACQNEDLQSTSLVNLSSLHCTNDSNKQSDFNATEVKEISVSRVPFFKRSAIIETCKYCKNKLNSDKPMPVQNRIKPVKITIDGENFLTTISVFKNVKSDFKINTKNTVSVQTDLCDIVPTSKTNYDETNECINKSLALDKMLNEMNENDIMLSEDLLVDDKNIYDQTKDVSKGLVIEESDSDTDLEVSGPMSVKADVHRSCEESVYGLLNSVLTVKKHESKPRRRPRGHTPTSTDSSEKENYNPNRIKKGVNGKKKCTKK
ncbi:unnamed protein product [Arctia plantaginis]|nr:unnamed protein product [Arctia plantaginis]